MDAKNKKLWQKPELTILVRNTPEESVLVGCKTHSGGGPNDGNYGCYSPVTCPPDAFEPCCCGCGVVGTS